MKHKVVFLFSIFSSISFGQNFGVQGFHGTDGRDGSPGANGVSKVIFAENGAGSYDLTGGNGTNGTSGTDGQDAQGCFHFQDAMNYWGANGGNAGRSGNGGRGGNGGTLTVYYNDIQQLKNIQVRGTPGFGGSAGPGFARSGNGCFCNSFSWEVSGVFYTCTNGQSGLTGTVGLTGARGNYGAVNLVAQTTPLEPDSPSAQIKMTEMENADVHLGKNIWERRVRANSLFAAGTDISDTYNLFTQRIQANLTFKWSVERPLDDFANISMLVSLDGTKAKIELPQTVWHSGQENDSGDQKVYEFTKAVLKNEVAHLTLDRLVNHDLDLIAQMNDPKKISHILTTKVFVEYYTEQNGAYRRRFNGTVPSEHVVSDAESVKVALGKLAIDPVYLKSGTKVYLKMNAERSLEQNKITTSYEKFLTVPN